MLYAYVFGRTVLFVFTGRHTGLDGRALDGFAYLALTWSARVGYLVNTALVVWLGTRLAQGRRWAMVGLGLYFLADLAFGIYRFDWPVLARDSFAVVYMAMRLYGGLGARPTDEPEPRVRVYGPDRAVVVLNYGFIAVDLFLSAHNILRAWHKDQDMGAVELIPYMGQHWWVHAHYLVGVALELWAIRSLGRSQRWALILVALLSASYLPTPIRYLHWFWIVNNAFTLAYCLLRLAKVLGPTESRATMVPSPSTTGKAEERT